MELTTWGSKVEAHCMISKIIHCFTSEAGHVSHTKWPPVFARGWWAVHLPSQWTPVLYTPLRETMTVIRWRRPNRLPWVSAHRGQALPRARNAAALNFSDAAVSAGSSGTYSIHCSYEVTSKRTTAAAQCVPVPDSGCKNLPHPWQ